MPPILFYTVGRHDAKHVCHGLIKLVQSGKLDRALLQQRRCGSSQSKPPKPANDRSDESSTTKEDAQKVKDKKIYSLPMSQKAKIAATQLTLYSTGVAAAVPSYMWIAHGSGLQEMLMSAAATMLAAYGSQVLYKSMQLTTNRRVLQIFYNQNTGQYSITTPSFLIMKRCLSDPFGRAAVTKPREKDQMHCIAGKQYRIEEKYMRDDKDNHPFFTSSKVTNAKEGDRAIEGRKSSLKQVLPTEDNHSREQSKGLGQHDKGKVNTETSPKKSQRTITGPAVNSAKEEPKMVRQEKTTETAKEPLSKSKMEATEHSKTLGQNGQANTVSVSFWDKLRSLFRANNSEAKSLRTAEEKTTQTPIKLEGKPTTKDKTIQTSESGHGKSTQIDSMNKPTSTQASKETQPPKQKTSAKHNTSTPTQVSKETSIHKQNSVVKQDTNTSTPAGKEAQTPIQKQVKENKAASKASLSSKKTQPDKTSHGNGSTKAVEHIQKQTQNKVPEQSKKPTTSNTVGSGTTVPTAESPSGGAVTTTQNSSCKETQTEPGKAKETTTASPAVTGASAPFPRSSASGSLATSHNTNNKETQKTPDKAKDATTASTAVTGASTPFPRSSASGSLATSQNTNNKETQKTPDKAKDATTASTAVTGASTPFPRSSASGSLATSQNTNNKETQKTPDKAKDTTTASPAVTKTPTPLQMSSASGAIPTSQNHNYKETQKTPEKSKDANTTRTVAAATTVPLAKSPSYSAINTSPNTSYQETRKTPEKTKDTAVSRPAMTGTPTPLPSSSADGAIATSRYTSCKEPKTQPRSQTSTTPIPISNPVAKGLVEDGSIQRKSPTYPINQDPQIKFKGDPCIEQSSLEAEVGGAINKKSSDAALQTPNEPIAKYKPCTKQPSTKNGATDPVEIKPLIQPTKVLYEPCSQQQSSTTIDKSAPIASKQSEPPKRDCFPPKQQDKPITDKMDANAQHPLSRMDSTVQSRTPRKTADEMRRNYPPYRKYPDEDRLISPKRLVQVPISDCKKRDTSPLTVDRQADREAQQSSRRDQCAQASSQRKLGCKENMSENQRKMREENEDDVPPCPPNWPHSGDGESSPSKPAKPDN